MRLTKLTVLLTMVGSFLFPLMASAHGGMEHILGTVVDKGAKTFSVKTKAGQRVTLDVGEMTQVEKAGKPATVGDISVGDRVVVHAMKMGDGPNLMAHTIKVGATTKSQTKSGGVNATKGRKTIPSPAR